MEAEVCLRISIAVVKTMTKGNLGKKWLIWLIYPKSQSIDGP